MAHLYEDTLTTINLLITNGDTQTATEVIFQELEIHQNDEKKHKHLSDLLNNILDKKTSMDIDTNSDQTNQSNQSSQSNKSGQLVPYTNPLFNDRTNEIIRGFTGTSNDKMDDTTSTNSTNSTDSTNNTNNTNNSSNTNNTGIRELLSGKNMPPENKKCIILTQLFQKVIELNTIHKTMTLVGNQITEGLTQARLSETPESLINVLYEESINAMRSEVERLMKLCEGVMDIINSTSKDITLQELNAVIIEQFNNLNEEKLGGELKIIQENAEKGDCISQNIMGMIYEGIIKCNGKMILETDFTKAKEMYSKALLNNHKPALYNMCRLDGKIKRNGQYEELINLFEGIKLKIIKKFGASISDIPTDQLNTSDLTLKVVHDEIKKILGNMNITLESFGDEYIFVKNMCGEIDFMLSKSECEA